MSEADMDKALSDLLDYCLWNNRVCPINIHWYMVWCTLPPTAEGENPPPLPVILDEYLRTSQIMKQLVFRQHIKWAYDHGVFDEVDSYIRSIPEDQWNHFDK
jgi:hypothetical protein